MQKQFQSIHSPNRLYCFLLLILPIMLLSFFISFLFYQDERSHQDALHKGEEKDIIQHHEQRIRKNFINITNDLQILAESYSEYTNGKNPKDSLNNFTQTLRLFSQHRQTYDQIRLIDKNGMEQIRVNLVAGWSVIVPKKNLQHKGRRYYFQDTIKLNPGEIFISPFDLNMEHCTIEIPYKPVLRFGTPVFDQDGEKQGAVLLNYLGQEILDQLAEETTDRLNGKLMLLNRDSYWLYGEHQDDNWAFMWPEKANRTFAATYPEAWKTIATQPAGQFLINNNLFTFATIHPLSDGMTSTIISSTGCSAATGQSNQEIDAGDYYWKLVTRLPLDQVEQDHLTPARYNLLLFNMALFILLGPVGWLGVA